MNVLNYTELHTAKEITVLCAILERTLEVLQSDRLTHSQKRAIAKMLQAVVLDGFKQLIVDEKQKGDLPF